jgi:hypothetical protein
MPSKFKPPPNKNSPVKFLDCPGGQAVGWTQWSIWVPAIVANALDYVGIFWDIPPSVLVTDILNDWMQTRMTKLMTANNARNSYRLELDLKYGFIRDPMGLAMGEKPEDKRREPC